MEPEIPTATNLSPDQTTLTRSSAAGEILAFQVTPSGDEIIVPEYPMTANLAPDQATPQSILSVPDSCAVQVFP